MIAATSPTRTLGRGLLLGATTCVLGCGMDFDATSLVTRPRFVGARASVIGDPARSAPVAGERVRVEPWILQPAEASLVRGRARVCLARDVRRGAASCLGSDLVEDPVSAPGDGLPSVEFAVPATLPPFAQLLVVWGSCDRGAEPSFDAESGRVLCDDAMARAELTTLLLPVAGNASLGNRNPSLEDERVELDGMPWPASTATPPGPCVDSGLRVLRVPADAIPPGEDGAYEVPLRFTSTGDREAVVGMSGTSLEVLQFSHYVTAGVLSRSFSAVEGTAADAMLELGWSPPAVATLPSQGTIVRFTWIVRDLRGGFARLDRQLCVAPAP